MNETYEKKVCPICKNDKASISRTSDLSGFLINCRVCGVAFKVNHEAWDNFDSYLLKNWDREELIDSIARRNVRDEFPAITSSYLKKLFGS